MQIAELDANAFATAIMDEYFHLRPLFYGMSEKVKQAIFELAKQL